MVSGMRVSVFLMLSAMVVYHAVTISLSWTNVWTSLGPLVADEIDTLPFLGHANSDCGTSLEDRSRSHPSEEKNLSALVLRAVEDAKAENLSLMDFLIDRAYLSGNSSLSKGSKTAKKEPQQKSNKIEAKKYKQSVSSKGGNATRLELVSAVEYFACCGIGHRLVRMANAAHVARQLNFGLRGFWGFCGDTEVFSYLFEHQREDELANVTSTNKYVRFRNEVPGYKLIFRNGPDRECPCHQDKIDSDLHFYHSLRSRFRRREVVAEYVKKHFEGRLVLGMHLRAGNGETGNFLMRKRQINNATEYVKSMSNSLVELTKGSKHVEKRLPVLFVATDEAAMIDRFREELKGKIEVVDLPQVRPEEGQGVLFGESTTLVTNGTNCLTGWEAALMDMVLLSHADVVVAARKSSFVQTMPMSIVFGRPVEERKVRTPYCEINTRGALQCFETLMDWGCMGYSHSWEAWSYLLQQERNKTAEDRFEIHRRGVYDEKCIPKAGGGMRGKCIPLDWKLSA